MKAACSVDENFFWFEIWGASCTCGTCIHVLRSSIALDQNITFAPQCFGLKFLKDCGSSTEQVSHCSTSVKISLHWCSAPDHRLHRRPLKDGLRLKSFKMCKLYDVNDVVCSFFLFSIICVDLCAHFLAKMRWVAAIDSYAASGKRTLWNVPSLFLTVFPVVHLDVDSNCSMWNCASTWLIYEMRNVYSVYACVHACWLIVDSPSPVQHLSTKLAEEVRICCWQAGRWPTANPGLQSYRNVSNTVKHLDPTTQISVQAQVLFSCCLVSCFSSYLKQICFVSNLFRMCQLRLCTKVEMFGASKGTCRRELTCFRCVEC